MELTKRPRRLRGSENLRKMVRETRMDKSSLMYPMFVMEGENKEEEIPSMTGQYRYSLDHLPYKLEQLSKAGVGSVMFLVFLTIRMKWAAVPMIRRESFRELFALQKRNFRSFIM